MSSSGDAPAYLGRYRIERVLGRGAMGIVYLAFDPHIERQVALKTIRDDLLGVTDTSSSTQGLSARFLNEARAAGRLVHPNIVRAFDFDRDGTLVQFFGLWTIVGSSFQVGQLDQ